MPTREKNRERTAGLFVLIGLVLLGVLIVEFGRFGDRFKGHYPLYIEFPDTAGIIKNSEVRLRGAKIGRVATEPELTIGKDVSNVSMEMRIRDDIKIPIGSVFQIGSSGLLGDKYIEITPPDKQSDIYYKAGDNIVGAGAGGFDALKSDAQNIARDASILINEAKVTFEKIDEALDSIKQIGDSLNVAITKVNKELLSDENMVRLNKTLANFETSSGDIKSASAELKPAVTEARETIASIKKAAENTQQLITDARTEISHIRPAVRSISRAASKAEKTMAALQNKDGLLGSMAYDKETGTNAREFVKNIKRYGILRYRDDSSEEDHDPRNKFRGSRR